MRSLWPLLVSVPGVVGGGGSGGGGGGGSPPRYLSSFAYTIDRAAPAHGSMWSADDFITRGPDGRERPWQNLLLVTGNDTEFAALYGNFDIILDHL